MNRYEAPVPVTVTINLVSLHRFCSYNLKAARDLRADSACECFWVSSSPASLRDLAQQDALQLPDLAFLRQRQALPLRSFLLLQQLLDVAGGAQEDVARCLHGEDRPPQSLPGNRERRKERMMGHPKQILISRDVTGNIWIDTHKELNDGEIQVLLTGKKSHST